METVKLKKEFIILGVIIVALSVYLFQRSGDRTRYTLPEVPALAASEITKIEITRAGQSVVLVRKDERWVIDPPGVAAAPKSVQEMLEALTGLTLTALVAESEELLPLRARRRAQDPRPGLAGRPAPARVGHRQDRTLLPPHLCAARRR